MCGICGIYDLTGGSVDRTALRRMSRMLAHRGPDDAGEHHDGSLSLGHRRLSILDLTGGRQPMSTPDGRFSVVFNGEIYNHLELRRDLEASGAVFRTRSDAETLLQLFARHGTDSFRLLNGMFAAAFWDARTSDLTLVRDPIGIKPLYYRRGGGVFAFASELKALLAGGFGRELDPAGVLDYLAYAKTHAPRTIAHGVQKLFPAHFLRVRPSGMSLERYWRLPGTGGPVAPGVSDAAGEGQAAAPLGAIGASGTAEAQWAAAPPLPEAVDRLEALISDAVRGNTLSDVPVGAFLSGGVDSGLVAAMMVRHFGAGRVSTFSVGFSGAGKGVDESEYARAISKHLGTDHHELILPADVLGRLDESISLLDEPIGDSAILPTFLVARFAREQVKVVLTGEGADELFAGYNRYKAAWLNEALKKLPVGAGAAAPLARMLGKGKLFDSLPIADGAAWALAQAHSTPEGLRGVLHPDLAARLGGGPPEWASAFTRMDTLGDALAFDLGTVLPDALLMKADKSTMKASLEARVPFLDKPVVEFAARLPGSYKVRAFKGKYILRLVGARHLPRRIAWRRKHGFIVPWESWVRDRRNTLLRDLLWDDGFLSRRIFDGAALRGRYERLVRGDRDVDAGLFYRVVVLGLWLNSLKSEGISL